jgi:hypothetical protein
MSGSAGVFRLDDCLDYIGTSPPSDDEARPLLHGGVLS